MANPTSRDVGKGASPASRGGAGAYVEGELGATYLLAMLADAEARGLPGCRIERVRFQGEEDGYTLDDIVVHGLSRTGTAVLEIQSKRTITFSPGDPIFKQVCEQVASAARLPAAEGGDHQMAVATQRTSHKISGPYQDVLAWARALDNGQAFARRVDARGVAGDAARTFAATFRAHLVEFGIEDEDDAVWRVMRRFQILEFDFEAVASMARNYALDRARMALHPDDASKAGALWKSLVATSLEAAKVGGSLDRGHLRGELAQQGYRLAGHRDYVAARARLGEMARLSLGDIGETIGGIHVPRSTSASALAAARDEHRYIEVVGGPGVGKSALLRQIARGVLGSARILVLDAQRTPSGGWLQLATALGVPGTARDFLEDMAAAGGAVVLIDGLDGFDDPAKRATVNDVLREVSAIAGFSVITTSRTSCDPDEDDWLAPDALEALGGRERVLVGELADDEVAVLGVEAPELGALLAGSHPAAALARNPYRLSRLSRVADPARIRTEAALADHWWQTGDGRRDDDLRARQRILADLADVALAGGTSLASRDNSTARRQLLASLTLREPRRDHLAFQHDVLRDWAVGARLHEARDLLEGVDLARPTPSSLTRGVEMAGRLALERGRSDGSDWLALLGCLSRPGAHGSWRRHALLALVRSERARSLLTASSSVLLADGGRLVAELARAVVAVDTLPVREILAAAATANVREAPEVARSLRAPHVPSARRLLAFCVEQASALPLQSMPSVLSLAEVFLMLPWTAPTLAGPVVRTLFDWLTRLDLGASNAVPSDPRATPLPRTARERLLEDLRQACLLFAGHAPMEAGAYLRSVGELGDPYRVEGIRRFAPSLARSCPDELAALVEGGLLSGTSARSRRDDTLSRAFHHSDANYLPVSPAQPPFLNLLEARPEVGLGLIRRLTAHAVSYFSEGRELREDGLVITFDDGPRVFPWIDTYLWSRDQALDYSVASGLMALEAWGHQRLDAGEDAAVVVADVLGPSGGCAAFVLVAVDLLLSHWPRTRAAAVPFVSCPHLLSLERGRPVHDHAHEAFRHLGREPLGATSLADISRRPSRGRPLEIVLAYYSTEDEISRTLRTRLRDAVEALPFFGQNADFGDPAFMGFHAVNLTDPRNWRDVDGRHLYVEPREETDHLDAIRRARDPMLRLSSMEAMVSLAISDRARGSADLARQAVEFAGDDLPDGREVDHLRVRTTHLVATAMLVARDGDDDLIDARAEWVRDVARLASAGADDRWHDRHLRLDYNPLGLAASALLHLWIRRRARSDLEKALSAAARRDPSAAPAFADALGSLVAVEPRLPKAVLRIALGARVGRGFSTDEAQLRAWEREADEVRRLAVSSEVGWLDGGPEPPWPTFPLQDVVVTSRRGHSSRGRVRSRINDLFVDTDSAALWLDAITASGGPEFRDWLSEVFEAYADWTAQANGLGLEASSEIDRLPSKWNWAFYGLAARVVEDLSEPRFQRFVEDVIALPDDAFGDVATIILRTSDIRSLSPAHSGSDRTVRVREAFARRTLAHRRWEDASLRVDPSVEFRLGPLVAALFMNDHGSFGSTQSYLPSTMADGVSLMLEALRPLLRGGPVAFVALCLTNTLLVSPRARDASLLLDAVEAWFDRVGDDRVFWVDVGIGKRAVEWLERATDGDCELLSTAGEARVRIDRVLGRLVAIGIPEAHGMEQRIAS